MQCQRLVLTGQNSIVSGYFPVLLENDAVVAVNHVKRTVNIKVVCEMHSREVDIMASKVNYYSDRRTAYDVAVAITSVIDIFV